MRNEGVAVATLPQFNIASHYDVMAELDRDIHENEALSRSEVEATLQLLGAVPQSLFLPCFGTGRHIRHFLDAGVKRIVGVDLSPKCIAKAACEIGSNPAVELIEADLTTWRTEERFDAAVLLGNSFADCINPNLLRDITQGMVQPLKTGGNFMMDYIGDNYLSRCSKSVTSQWSVQFQGQPAWDYRTPEYNALAKIMTIRIRVEAQETEQLLWQGHYQKLILTPADLEQHFAAASVDLKPVGFAADLQAYVRHHEKRLGMIGKSIWWTGVKI